MAGVIPVGPQGSAVITFNTPASTNGWTTALRLPNSGAAISNSLSLDTAVQTNVASAITMALGITTSGQQGSSAFWHTGLQYIYTRPAGVSYHVLMATLENQTGADVGRITVSFTAGAVNVQLGHMPGWLVYYSVTGQPYEWHLIPEFSNLVTNGALTATMALTSPWPNGGPLYLLWADDNADSVTDPAYTIDDFFVFPGDVIRLLYERLPDGEARITWVRPTASFMLEHTATFSGIGSNSWSQVPFPYQTNGNMISVTLAPTNAGFFRVRSP